MRRGRHPGLSHWRCCLPASLEPGSGLCASSNLSIPFRAVLILVVAVTLATATGCLVRRRKVSLAVPPNTPLLTADLDRLMQSLRTRYDAFQSLDATVDLEPSVVSAGKGEIADYKDVRGYILVRKPASIRVIALYPVVRATAFDMVSDGETFRLFLPVRNLFVMGQNRIDKPSPRKIENLRPQHLLDPLLIRPPDPATEQAVLENWTDGSASYIVHILRRDAAGRLLLDRNVWFDRISLAITRQQLYDDRGDLVTDARYSGWRQSGGITFPTDIVISRPKDEYELQITFLKTAFNLPIGEDRFNLVPPPGATIQKVGEEAVTEPPDGGKAGG